MVEVTGELSPSVFLSRFVSRNRPVLMRGAAKDWLAVSKWSFDSLAALAPAAPVTLERVETGLFDPNKNIGRPKIEYIDTTLADAVPRIMNPPQSGAYYVRETEFGNGLEALLSDLGDVNLRPVFTRLFEPRIWIGSKGAASPLHYDGGDSNLLVHLQGTKEFNLYPPEDEAYLYPNTSGHLPHLSKVNSLSPDLQTYPDFAKARCTALLLEPGDILYVPERWWHSTRSPEASISVNFWWQPTALSKLATRLAALWPL